MKVNSAPRTFGSIDRDAPKREKNREEQQKKDESGSDARSFSAVLNEDTVGTAVEAFAHDSEVLASGLNAAVEGQGPGLRVTLKDGRGAILRQFTGEEFVRLREAAAGPRGKLLDKKL